LKPEADYLAFETELYKIINKSQVFSKYNRSYFITNITSIMRDKIKRLPQVDLKGYQRFTTAQIDAKNPK
jgi:hypothetical protein